MLGKRGWHERTRVGSELHKYIPVLPLPVPAAIVEVLLLDIGRPFFALQDFGQWHIYSCLLSF